MRLSRRSTPSALLFDDDREVRNFGKYSLLGRMTGGGMAELYLALQNGPEGFSKVVVVKRAHRDVPTRWGGPNFPEMFLDEARLGARLDHPNIVSVTDLGEHMGQYFMAMEYLPGEDMECFLRRLSRLGQCTLAPIAAAIVRDVLSGLDYVHNLADDSGRPLGLVHRDINPSNIMLTYHGVVKLLDFGVAKARTNTVRTVSGTVKGKLAYLSTEQLLDGVVDARSDIFAAGVVLWELLTGRDLFRGATDAETLNAVMSKAPPHPSTLRPSLPKALDRIVLKALERRPDDRYQTAGQMRDELSEFLDRHAPARLGPSELASWLRGIFSPERAEAKLALAQGRNVLDNARSVIRLDAGASWADLPSVQNRRTGRTVPGKRPSHRSSGSRLRALVTVLASLALLGLAVAFVLVEGGIGGGGGDDEQAVDRVPVPGAARSPATTTVATTSLEIESVPAGAAIWIDDQLSPFRTPATITGLSAGSSLDIRVTHPGHEPQVDQVRTEAGSVARRRYVLAAEKTRLWIRSAPPNARLFVDGNEYEIAGRVELEEGPHAIHILAQGGFIEDTVTIRPGLNAFDVHEDKLERAPVGFDGQQGEQSDP